MIRPFLFLRFGYYQGARFCTGFRGSSAGQGAFELYRYSAMGTALSSRGNDRPGGGGAVCVFGRSGAGGNDHLWRMSLLFLF